MHERVSWRCVSKAGCEPAAAQGSARPSSRCTHGCPRVRCIMPLILAVFCQAYSRPASEPGGCPVVARPQGCEGHSAAGPEGRQPEAAAVCLAVSNDKAYAQELCRLYARMPRTQAGSRGGGGSALWAKHRGGALSPSPSCTGAPRAKIPGTLHDMTPLPLLFWGRGGQPLPRMHRFPSQWFITLCRHAFATHPPAHTRTCCSRQHIITDTTRSKLLRAGLGRLHPPPTCGHPPPIPVCSSWQCGAIQK